MKSHTNRSFAGAYQFRNLLGAQFFKIPQHDDGSIILGQTLQRLVDHRHPLFALGEFFRMPVAIRFRVVPQETERRQQVLKVLLGHHIVAAGFSQVCPGQVDGDGAQPRGDFRLPSKRIDVLNRLQERFLSQIADFILVTNKSSDAPVNATALFPNESVESARIPRL